MMELLDAPDGTKPLHLSDGLVPTTGKFCSKLYFYMVNDIN